MKSKKYYAVLPIGYELEQMHVIMIASDKRLAIKLYEKWNGPDYKLTKKEIKRNGLEIRELSLARLKELH